MQPIPFMASILIAIGRAQTVLFPQGVHHHSLIPNRTLHVLPLRTIPYPLHYTLAQGPE